MSFTFFTTSDGDVILRAGPESDSNHDFRVHKFILSLASSVFKDMFAFPQPPDQNRSEEHQLPIIDIPDPPAVLDTILRLIYPGVEPPKIVDLPFLSALLSAADKYNIVAIYPVFRDALRTLPGNPFKKYVIACRFGFAEEAEDAAEAGNSWSVTSEKFDEEIRQISSTDLFRWFWFIQEREGQGRTMIEESLNRWEAESDSDCTHKGDGAEFYYRLEKEVRYAFVCNPRLGSKDLFALLDKVPDPPLGCEPPPDVKSGESYHDCYAEVFRCPLRPMTIRHKLMGIAHGLDEINRYLLEKAFEKGIGSD